MRHRGSSKYVAKKKFKVRSRRGYVWKEPGDIVDVLTSADLARYLVLDCIEDPRLEKDIISGGGSRIAAPAQAWSKTKRVGVFAMTTSCYSGGRILMWQYLMALANNGWEAYYISNQAPTWLNDYPKPKGLKVLIMGVDPVPQDIDLIVTNAKSEQGRIGASYHHKRPDVPFVIWNFETPNFVHKFVPKDRLPLQPIKEPMEDSDLVLSCSKVGADHAEEYAPGAKEHAVLWPASNSIVMDNPSPCQWPGPKPGRDYVVWVGRGDPYKGFAEALKVVWGLDKPLDLVALGTPVETKTHTDKHKLYKMQTCSDQVKYDVYRGAKAVLATSHHEGAGMVVGEALGSGTPVIGYDLPTYKELYDDWVITVPLGDTDAMRVELSKLLNSGKGLATETQAACKGRHSLGTMERRVEDLPYHSFKKPKISVSTIAYWGFFPESIEAVYPHVDEIRIAFGPIQRVIDDGGLIDDGSLDRIKALPDPDGKITLETREVWRDKLEMRQWCTSKLRGTHHLQIDGDEIFIGLDKWVAKGIFCGCPRWVHFWKSAKHWVHDAPGDDMRWGERVDPYGGVCRHYRWSWWRNSYRYNSHCQVTDSAGNSLTLYIDRAREIVQETPECVMYHLGHVLDADTMAAKHKFYLSRDGADKTRKKRQAAWNEYTGALGKTEDGFVATVDWELPEIVTRALSRVEGGGFRA